MLHLRAAHLARVHLESPLLQTVLELELLRFLAPQILLCLTQSQLELVLEVFLEAQLRHRPLDNQQQLNLPLVRTHANNKVQTRFKDFCFLFTQFN